MRAFEWYVHLDDCSGETFLSRHHTGLYMDISIRKPYKWTLARAAKLCHMTQVHPPLACPIGSAYMYRSHQLLGAVHTHMNENLHEHAVYDCHFDAHLNLTESTSVSISFLLFTSLSSYIRSVNFLCECCVGQFHAHCVGYHTALMDLSVLTNASILPTY